MHFLRPQRPNRLQHLHLFVANRVRLVPNRRLHRGDHQQLQQMILEHVAHDAGRVVVAGPAADVDFFGHRDLHVVDVVAIPNRLEDRVREPQHEQVLHGLFAEVVIDAVDLLLAEDFVNHFVEPLRPKPDRCRTAFR